MRAMSSPARRRRVATLVVATVLVTACRASNDVTTASANVEGPSATSSTPATSEPSASSSVPSDSASEPSPDGSSIPDESAPASSAPSTDATPIPGSAGTKITWERVDDHLDKGTLEVPVDYSDPSLGNFRLFLVRRRANDQAHKVGSLLINPGGPGAGGAVFAAGADFVFKKDLLDKFDIIGWDPRGTAYTRPAIDCIDDYDKYFAGTDITPDTPAERQQIIDLAKDLEDRCVSKNSAILQHVGTNDSARDMDSIRKALGEDKISYFGFSYGSELGATWATMFPQTVRAAVLDGAVDPTLGLTEANNQQAVGFEHTLGLYLDNCTKDTQCAFYNGGNTAQAFDQLMNDLDQKPIPSKPGRPDITRGVALQAVATAMYDSSMWKQLSQALADAQKGDGAGLLALWDSYYERNPDGTWPNFLEAFQVITCMDDTERPTVEQDDANAQQLSKLAPRFAPNTTGSYICTWFPEPTQPRIPITGAGAGPIVVIGTTGDPATPLGGTEVMAKTLQDGRLIIVTADKHTGYGENDCVDNAVGDYLIDLKVPPSQTQC
jgi:pimeloyl-ACP methyl ester carboxylesterase